MKLYIDTANLQDIEEALKGGFVRGITTNPSLLSKEPKGAYLEHMAKIAALANKYGGAHSVSIEVFSAEPEEMVAQASEFVRTLGYPHLAVKIPISHKGRHYLEVIRELSQRGIRVNCTAGMNAMQMALAAASGASYVSIFYNRLRDGGAEEKFAAPRADALKNKVLEASDFDPDQVIRDTRALIAPYPGVEIISGSIRTATDVKRAGLAGSHIVTTSLKIIKESLVHYKTDEAVDQFLADFKAWIS